MGKVKYATGIDYVSGALSKPKVKDGHSCGTYLLGTHRTKATENPNCTRLYIHDADTFKRSTPLSEDELAARTRFAIVSAQVAQRKKNLATMNQDREAFYAQKDTPGGKKTLVSYLWMVVGAAYDAEHPGE